MTEQTPGLRAAPPYPQGHSLLEGRSVLVTAAAGTGIGFATAQRCAEEGARVMLSDRHAQRLEQLAHSQFTELDADDPQALLQQPADIQRLAAQRQKDRRPGRQIESSEITLQDRVHERQMEGRH